MPDGPSVTLSQGTARGFWDTDCYRIFSGNQEGNALLANCVASFNVPQVPVRGVCGVNLVNGCGWDAAALLGSRTLGANGHGSVRVQRLQHNVPLLPRRTFHEYRNTSRRAKNPTSCRKWSRK